MTTNDNPINNQLTRPSQHVGDVIEVGDIEGSSAVAIGPGARAEVTYLGLSIEEVAALVVELKSKDQPQVWDGRIPYLGLKAYQESDAEFFFGRGELVNDLLERLVEARYIVIAGPSGSGKSSVARAGLFRALRRGRIEHSENWVLATMSPKDDPIANLALALGRDGGDRAAAKAILNEGLTNPFALHEQVELFKAMSDDPQRRFVLLVDQFEEVFTQTKNEEAREAFIKLLTTATAVENGRTIILLSLRSDFVSNCALSPDLRAQINKKSQFQLVGAMAPRDLAKAITLPSLEVGAEIDPALVAQIIDDMKGEPGALPLMSFALRDLFMAEKTRPGEAMDLTLQEYLDRGGIDNTLERHANQVFALFTAEQKLLAKSIFSRLITVGEGRLDTRRTADFDELVPAGAEESSVAAVVGKLAQEKVRLVITSGIDSDDDLAGSRATVTIAHEKLIEAWPWLRRLVDENRELIALQNQINHDAREWTAEEDSGFLYRGGRLLHLEEKLDSLEPSLDELSRRFIQASIDERQRRIAEKEAQRRRTITILAAATAVALGLAAVALFFFYRSNQSLAEAKLHSERALAQSLVANSRALVSSQYNNQILALARLLAVEGDQLIDHVGSTNEKTGSEGWLYSLAYDQPIPYQAVNKLSHSSNSPELELPGDIRSIAWNEDSSRLASAADDHTVIIWDTESWQPLTTLTNHTSSVWSVAWSGDSSRLASTSLDHTVIIWDTDSWQPQTTLSGHTEAVSTAAWNEDDSRLATASCNQLFSDDGCSAGEIIIWDTESWQPLTTLKGHTDWVEHVAWNGDGSRLASASDDDTVIIWNTATWKPLISLAGHTGNVVSVAWNHDSSLLASAADDHIIVIWDVESWESLTTLANHTTTVWDLAWNGDSSRLASASGDDKVIIWDTASWQPLTTLTDHTLDVLSIAWNEDGSRLASASVDSEIIIWDMASWQPLTTLIAHADWVNSVAWDKDGSRLASSSFDNSIIIWDMESRQPLDVLTGHKYGVESVAWNGDGSRLASASYAESNDENELSTGEIIIWDTATWQPLTTLTGHTDWVFSVAWNGDGRRLASASSDGTIIIWDTAKWQPLATLSEHSDVVWNVAWDGDGSRLASASCAEFNSEHKCIVGEVIIWDTTSWQPQTILRDHTSWVHSVAWNRAGNRLASASADGTFIIWDTVYWKPLVTTLAHEADSLTSTDWNKDDGYLATASFGGSIIIWDTASWLPLETFNDHSDSIWSIAWNEDGSRLASASSDKTVVIREFPEVAQLQCRLAGRNLSLAEWEQYLPDVDYRCTCEEWPAGEEAPPRAPGCAREY